MIQTLYNIGIRSMSFGIRLAKPYKNKARLWVDGRKDWETKMRAAFSENKAPVLWFHVASLGEFEQGRELITACKQKYPEKKILLTFFSPSGYEACKNTPLADFVFYLPIDIPRYASCFLDIVKPQTAIFVKYEYWFNFMKAMHKRKIPLYFVAARFRKEQYFFKFWASWFRRRLRAVTGFFVQDTVSLECLTSIRVKNVYVAGDTRFDRVMRLPEEKVSYPIIEKFIGEKPVIVAGSVWDEDIAMIRDCKANDIGGFKWIIVPHEVKKSRIADIQKYAQLDGCVLYSQVCDMPKAEGYKLEESNIIIIDKVGMLSKLYRYGAIAYIGGGFGKGIHNTLEPAVYGKPILFGPKYTCFSEAVDLVNIGAAFCVRDVEEMEGVIKKLSNDSVLKESSESAAKYVREHDGAVSTIMEKLSSTW